MSNSPRIPPLTEADCPEDAREILANWPYNLHKTLARNLPTLTQWMPYAEHILRENTLPAWDREIAILRVAWNARSDYEWGLHARLARTLGFDDAALIAIARGTPRSGATDAPWAPHEAALIDAVDDIMSEWKVSDAVWEVLAGHYDERQLIDFVFVTCQFLLVAVTLRTLGVPLEEGVETLPTL